MGENKCFVLGFKEEITTQQEKNKKSWGKKKKKTTQNHRTWSARGQVSKQTKRNTEEYTDLL